VVTRLCWRIGGGSLVAVAALVAGGCAVIAGLSGNYTLAPDAGADAGKGRADAGSHDTGTKKTDAGHSDAGAGKVDSGKVDSGKLKVDSGRGTPDASSCYSLQPPGPPSPSANGGSITFVAAVRTVDIGDKGDTPGYDLDKIDTCCDDAGPSCTSVKIHCDAPGGVDNGAGVLLADIQLADSELQLGSTSLSSRAAAGDWSLLIQVSGYNGKADDFGVNVTLFPSPGLGKTPAWDGSDSWPVNPTSVGDGGLANPVYTSQGAFVSGGVLVAAVPEVQIDFGGQAGFFIDVVGGVLTGNLVKDGTGWKITNGIIAGRWPTAQVFRSLGAIHGPGGSFCTNSTLFSYVKTAVCQGADILANASDPVSDPCDSVSFGIGFTADPALLGGVGPTIGYDGGCAPEASPSNVTCN
jgi:hypothetical protein